MKTLVAGPWVGSLHTELVCWQGYLRALSLDYDETIIITPNSKKSIYSDFATKLVNPEDATAIESSLSMADRDVTFFTKKDIPVEWVDHQPIVRDQIFSRIGGFTKYPKYGLLIDSPDSCHLKAQDWSQLIYDLDEHLDVAWVNDELTHGISHYGTDLRGCSFDDLVSAVTDSEVVIGPSGSTVVLAALCGVPFITWVDKGCVNLYRDLWNPLNTLGTSFNGLPSVTNIKEHVARIAHASANENSHE